MAKNSSKEELVKACKAATPAGDGEKIAAGRTMWFEGRPAAAEAGMVALDTAGGSRIIVRERDVGAVERSGDQYLVEVAEGADLLVRVEKVVKAEMPCGCNEGGSNPASQRTSGMPISMRFCVPVVRYVCRFVTDSRGVGRVICIPFIMQDCHWIDMNAPSF